MQMDSALDTGKGLARIVGAGFKSPMDFSLNVAKGFHNVPKLYGGEVRKVDNVTDLKSGLSTAAKVSCTTSCQVLLLTFMSNSDLGSTMESLASSPILTRAPKKKAVLAL